ncbi:hypothetical protein [Marilutibacter chinensis]|uniref:Uncharacterized protein n=1 Tax=Marilutibacter chinensis TaxID=2912247 RepID=A0ABS9HTF9_9GAMM|nr:hypothetical protein [Lysobacter chinensis]MCF7222186.1 hypothetical protein [Lysobacter chinensis]
MNVVDAWPWLALGTLPLAAATGRLVIERRAASEPLSPPWQAQAWDATRDAVLCAALFVLLGPPVGTLALWLALLIFAEGSGVPAQEALQAGLLMLPFGWIFGGVQAAVAGMVAGLLRPLGGGLLAHALVLAAALVASICVAFVLGIADARGGAGVARVLMLPALVATPVCMWALHRRRG